MTDRELRKLSRSDLLEMLIDLSEELNLVKQQLRATEEKLNNRQILIDKAGSIAEASLQLNGVFEAAEAASKQYMENIRNLSDRQDEICRRIEWECREKARRRLEEVERKCMQMEADTIERCAKSQAMAKVENTRNLSDPQDEICRRIEWECREKARRRLEEVERKCMQMEADTIERCAKMQAMAKVENIRNLSDPQDEIRSRIEWECREQARSRLEEVERKRMQMEADTIERYAKMQAMAKAENPTTWKYSYGARA